MEKSSTSPATSNAIRGLSKAVTQPSNGLLGRVKRLEADMAI